jgi:hypothetical protein
LKDQDIKVTPVILGNGAAFDNSILDQICIEYKIKPNWSYKHSLCARTIFGMISSEYLEQNNSRYIDVTKTLLSVDKENFHNALFDAVYQAVKLRNAGSTFLELLVKNLD